jgi:glycerol kinase
VRTSAEVYGECDLGALVGGPSSAVPVAGDLGDQQAALFGQACFDPGETKNTYGTGSFLLRNTGPTPVQSRHGLLTTVAYSLPQQAPCYALEGSVFITGAAVQWLRDGLKVIASAPETEALARSVPDAGGVYFVPAFTGLGAPYWQPDARGTIVGVTRGTTVAHLARATLEAIAYQTRDVVDAMAADATAAGLEDAGATHGLKVDGGAAGNDFLCQFQSDLLNMPVVRTVVRETTALGAAFAAGLAVGYWQDLEEIRRLWQVDRVFQPALDAARRARLYAGWQRSVRAALCWAERDPGGGLR